MRFHWGITVVDFDIGVQPTRSFDVAKDIAAKYAGHWAIQTQETPFLPAKNFDTEIRYTGKYLISDMTLTESDEFVTMAYAPAAEQIFNRAWFISGEIAGVMEAFFIEFELDDSGVASTFEVRDPSDALWMSGTRIQP